MKWYTVVTSTPWLPTPGEQQLAAAQSHCLTCLYTSQLTCCCRRECIGTAVLVLYYGSIVQSTSKVLVLQYTKVRGHLGTKLCHCVHTALVKYGTTGSSTAVITTTAGLYTRPGTDRPRREPVLYRYHNRLVQYCTSTLCTVPRTPAEYCAECWADSDFTRFF